MTPQDLSVHGFRSHFADLATLTRNKFITAMTPNLPITLSARPTSIQQRIFDLLGLRWRRQPAFFRKTLS
jgi:hypothetical protein